MLNFLPKVVDLVKFEDVADVQWCIM